VGNHGPRLLVIAALAGLALAWVAYSEVYAPSGGRRVEYWTAAIGRLELPRARTEIFRTRAEYQEFVRNLDVAVTAPRIDFERDDAVLLAAGPRSSAGSAIEIVRVEEQRGRVLVIARERYRRGARAVVSYPSVVVVFRDTGKPIAIEWSS
jgi:hypothetical protein